jgi:hypothetical protein
MGGGSINLEERAHLEDLDVDRMKISKWILKVLAGRTCTGFFGLRIGTSSMLF